MFKNNVTPQNISAAAFFTLPFIVLLFALYFANTFTAKQMQEADPIIVFIHNLGILSIPLFSLAVCSVWLKIAPINSVQIRRNFVLALFGAGVAASILFLIRLVHGETLPAFIPPEESAKPGLLLGLSAGVIEEIVFRLVLLPGVYFLLKGKTHNYLACIIAVVITSFLFALSHEIYDPFSWSHFMTRFALPGCVMSLAFFVIGPAFIVTAHCTAHLFLPLLFV
ncbi:CPBP family glutamic-type intramembrane protease [Candidatus Uabimicrobium amorphum]|uniref:CAAX prenyl protease 2/Lysostaphin resistance protein A-like domain-containing protein n=1 Tax=Uabimicrobium amorphum TaxID=2596890 RepID=A0A5S9IK52_UABAM|nr:CPBP family glutamic-type intramembrane protease [Candidatus Uabimicrobium amorphum]BBM82852.1 hypothetical protein UABAM_01195 [Candidatus Uabimicrobium amorphum]